MGYVYMVLGIVFVLFIVIAKLIEFLSHVSSGIKDAIEAPAKEREQEERKLAERFKVQSALIERDSTFRKKMNFFNLDYASDQIKELVERNPETWKILEHLAIEREAVTKAYSDPKLIVENLQNEITSKVTREFTKTKIWS